MEKVETRFLMTGLVEIVTAGMNLYYRDLERSWSISSSLFSKHLYDELIAETYRCLSLCQGNLQDDGAAIVIRVSNPERLAN